MNSQSSWVSSLLLHPGPHVYQFKSKPRPFPALLTSSFPVPKPPQQQINPLLPPRLNNIPMTRNNPLILPRLNHLRTLPHPHPVLPARRIPQKPPLPLDLPRTTHQPIEQLIQKPTPRILKRLRLRVLLRRRQVKHEIRLDQRARRLVQKRKLLVLVRVEVLVAELRVELLRDPHVALVRRGKHVREFEPGGRGVRLAFLGETFGADHRRGGVLLRPGGQEDVVLEVRRDQVLDFA